MPSKTRHPARLPTDNKPTQSADPALLPLNADLLWQATQAETTDSFLGHALPAIAATLGADYAALVAPSAGRWETVAESGTARNAPLPIDLLANVLDREIALADAGWIAAPLAARTEDGEVLAAYLAPSPPAPLPKGEGRREESLAKGEERREAALALIGHIVPVLHQALSAVRRRARQDRRLRRLEAILEIASQWNQTRELEPLLVQMAEAAARLLGADRASIFLWDRPNHTLVGRPALGLPDGELRIRDDRGVVGEVIRTGEPRRVDAATEPEVVDHHVDSQLRYQTRTLLCVPLRGRGGELFGAFELINKLVGTFTK
jgi:hypothetical protein